MIKSMASSTTKFWLSVIAWILGATIALGGTYATFSARLAIVEHEQSMVEQRLDRIERKLDWLIENIFGKDRGPRQ